jgi:hypothetical protein
MTFAGLRQHIFSTFHAKDLVNAIHKRKTTYLAYIEKCSAQSKACAFPKLYLTQTNDSHEFCITCKKFRTVKNNMPLDCNEEHKKQSMQFIKDCLAKEPSEQIIEVEVLKISDVDVEQLKKQVCRQQKEIATLKEMNEESSDDADALYTLLTYMHENDTHIFREIMQQLKKSHSHVHERQLKNFDIEE